MKLIKDIYWELFAMFATASLVLVSCVQEPELPMNHNIIMFAWVMGSIIVSSVFFKTVRGIKKTFPQMRIYMAIILLIVSMSILGWIAVELQRPVELIGGVCFGLIMMLLAIPPNDTSKIVVSKEHK